MLPRERIVAVDSGNFMGYPSAYLSVPDEAGFCFTQAFQSIGLGLATAVGAALARPDRLAVAALGDGGALMAAAELETVVRLGLPMVVVVYDDRGYGAEVHHFAGRDHATVTFPEIDLAAVGRGYGFEAVTVRAPADLDGCRRLGDGTAEGAPARARPDRVGRRVVVAFRSFSRALRRSGGTEACRRRVAGPPPLRAVIAERAANCRTPAVASTVSQRPWPSGRAERGSSALDGLDAGPRPVPHGRSRHCAARAAGLA